jgi:hypothetical protein
MRYLGETIVLAKLFPTGGQTDLRAMRTDAAGLPLEFAI